MNYTLYLKKEQGLEELGCYQGLCSIVDAMNTFLDEGIAQSMDDFKVVHEVNQTTEQNDLKDKQ